MPDHLTLLSGFAAPDVEALERGLRSVLADCGEDPDVRVDWRRPNRQASTFPSEVVGCRTSTGRDLHLFCKYADARIHLVPGHRGGVSYEETVYREVLGPLKLSTARLYGAFRDPETGQTCLVLECLNEVAQLQKSTDSTAALCRAARWLAEFHRGAAPRITSFGRVLNRYDGAYYRGWAHRTLDYAPAHADEFPWLSPLCARFVEFATELAGGSPTVIHGEFYPKSILTQGLRVCPVDWESAAIAIGEIDLASLTEGWPAEMADAAVGDYARHRWPSQRPPADFERRLAAANLYWQMRWLGERRQWTTSPRSRLRFERMRTEGERLGLI